MLFSQEKIIAEMTDSQKIEIYEDGILVKKFMWDEAKEKYQDADAVFEFGFTETKEKYWFYSSVPGKIIYIACMDLKNKEVVYFDPPELYFENDFAFNPEEGILIYSDWREPSDSEEKSEMEKSPVELHCYSLYDSEEKIIGRQTGRKFSPRLMDGKIICTVNGEEKTVRENPRSITCSPDGE